jgi:ABC-2 type transport system ATP-binding protein
MDNGSKKVVEIVKLIKKYGDLVAVNELDLDIHEGEIFGLLGPNGAGKSTTLRTCLGLLQKTSGDIRILGMDSHKESTLIRKRTGYIPSDFGLVSNIKVRTFLKHLLALSKCSSERKLIDLSERLDLDLTRKTHELSKGNKQKVGIIQAFMANQELVIMDEPTTGLDPLMQKEFYKLLRDEREAGKTFFMSSHILAEVEEVCDKVAIIKEGELVVVENITSLQNKMGKILEVHFRDPVNLDDFRFEGVTDLKQDNGKLTMTVMKDLDQVVKKVGEFDIVNMSLKTYSLEELFMRYYRDEGKGGAS